MGEFTSISWCDHTFNPVIGCTKLSPACDGCYAWARNLRFKDAVWGEPGTKSVLYRTSPSNWALLRRWHRKALKEGTRPFVFGGSLCDPFDNDWPPEWRRDYFELIRECPQLVLLLLTKRPQNIVKLSEEAGGLPDNVALGTTAEDQKRANQTIPHLLWAAAELKPLFTFVSIEPILGPVDLTQCWHSDGYIDATTGWWGENAGADENGQAMILGPGDPGYEKDELLPKLDWAITGGETDQGEHKARPWNPQWVRNLRDQCADVGIAFHHKQNGEFHYDAFVGSDRCETHIFDNPDGSKQAVYKVGKKVAGNALDGVIHEARPEVPAL